jgi:hypothetical protein
MELASEEQIQKYIDKADEFLNQPWQIMVKYATSKLAIIEFLAWQDGLTIYEYHKEKFDSHQNAS